ncbi:expressed unknown protein [Seminavis robusta]|uniref:Uncharacterized protein n=1 Tax=Seminavis robusta TaxID=568900 RepID=A0A9N8E7Y6_9STRA|nr:expressed unknown protein [Seminavis robusta]|eukprot:Sro752_g197141.1  (113) ;mRNA; f:14058-14396
MSLFEDEAIGSLDLVRRTRETNPIKTLEQLDSPKHQSDRNAALHGLHLPRNRSCQSQWYRTGTGRRMCGWTAGPLVPGPNTASNLWLLPTVTIIHHPLLHLASDAMHPIREP